MDSPAKQRFKLISEKWSNIAQNIDRDKEDRRQNLDENLSNLENRVANDRPVEEAKFRVAISFLNSKLFKFFKIKNLKD